MLGAAERVRTLLAPAASGWLPPPEPALMESVDHTDDTAAPPGAAEDAADDRRPGSGTGRDRHSADRPGAPWPDSDGPRVRTQSASSGTAGLRQGRLDPGRRGAVALVVVALLAALVAAAVVVAGRPREVTVPDTEPPGAAPQVVASGVPLPGAPPAGTPPPGAAAAPGTPAGEVVVAVAGKVQRPGLVRLPAGSRVDDAVRAAGGPLPGADAGLLNLARRLVDGEQVLVGVDPPPGAPVTGAPPGAAGPAAAAAGPLDLNAATVGDLDALPGIGPVLAQRIVDWRTEHGRFASVEQLREVTGIGESKYTDLEKRVRV